MHSPSRWCWWWWGRWWGPFPVYFLPILGGQKAALSDSVEGWLPGRGMVCSWQPRSFQGVHPHRWPNRWTEGRQGRMTGRVGSGAGSFIIPTSFTILYIYIYIYAFIFTNTHNANRWWMPFTTTNWETSRFYFAFVSKQALPLLLCFLCPTQNHPSTPSPCIVFFYNLFFWYFVCYIFFDFSNYNVFLNFYGFFFGYQARPCNISKWRCSKNIFLFRKPLKSSLLICYLSLTPHTPLFLNCCLFNK